MGEFITVKNLKKEPYMCSASIFFAEHCQMDVVLEELCGIEGINSLVVGVGECAYYSQKIPFSKNSKSWAYGLSNEEIIFGDLIGIEKALEELMDAQNKTICIFTCIPCLMNLDSDALKMRFPNVAFLSAPDYKGISSYDIRKEVYYTLFKDEETGKVDGISVWDWNNEVSIDAIRKRLQAKTHIIKNANYLKLFEHLALKYSILVIDDTRFNTASFYRKFAKELKLNENDIAEVEKLIEHLGSYHKINIRGTCAIDFAACLNVAGANVGSIAINGRAYNQRTHGLLKELPQDTPISFEETSVFPESDAVELDFSPYSKEISQKSGMDRLLFMLRRAEELCH